MLLHNFFGFGIGFNFLTSPLYTVGFDRDGNSAPAVATYLMTEDFKYIITEDSNFLIAQ